MHAAWSIAAAGASVPRPAAVAPRVAPRVVKAADLLSFERQGYWLDRGLLDKAQMQALAPALDRVYEEQTHAVLRQKVRVVLGDDALSQAEASSGSLRAQALTTHPDPSPQPQPQPHPHLSASASPSPSPLSLTLSLTLSINPLQIKEFRRLLEAAPDGAIPFLQLFNAWRHAPDVLQLLRSPRIASTAAQLLGLEPGAGRRVRLLQDSLFVKS